MGKFMLKHFLFSLTKFIGMRDRLRCPRCRAVGTYKPHGGLLLDWGREYRVPRFICKWCGLYEDKRGRDQAYANLRLGHWVIKRHWPDKEWADDVEKGNLVLPSEIIKTNPFWG